MPRIKSPGWDGWGARLEAGELVQKEFEVHRRTDRVGRSSVEFFCPFCDYEVEAFIWSLCGGGKVCEECGALFGGRGGGLHFADPRERGLTEPQHRLVCWLRDQKDEGGWVLRYPGRAKTMAQLVEKGRVETHSCGLTTEFRLAPLEGPDNA